MPAPPLTLQIISDAVCPWCYVGKRRVQAALAQMPDVDAEVSWLPFLLDPTVPAEGMSMDTYLARKFGRQGMKRLVEVVEKAGESVGIAFAFDRIEQRPNSVDAHRLIGWAEPGAQQDAVVEAVFHRYFERGEDIGKADVLVEIAGAAGMDPELTRERLAGDEDRTHVLDQAERARHLGVTGVPFTIIGGTVAVTGAQQPALFVEIIEKVRRAG